MARLRYCLLAVAALACGRRDAGQSVSAVVQALSATDCDANPTACCPTGFKVVPLTNASDNYSNATASRCILGLDGSDVIFSATTSGASAVFGGKGDDNITVSGPGPHVVRGGEGNDVIFVTGNSTIVPGAGADNVSTGNGNTTITINDLCEVASGKSLSAGGSSDTLVTPVSLTELQKRGVTATGFEKVVIKQNSCQASCVQKPLCSGNGTCAEGATQGIVECRCNPGFIGPNCDVPAGDLDACGSKIPFDATLSEAEAEKKFQADLARFCIAPEADRCLAAFIAAANADSRAAALRLVAQTFTPAQYLALSRDRSRKLLLARSNSTWACAVSGKDADHDLVPDDRDKCSGTPELTATDDSGCTLTSLPQAPSADDVKAILDHMGILFDGRCEGAPVPSRPIPVDSALDFEDRDHDSAGNIVRFITVRKIANQPSGCPLWYEFQFDGSPPLAPAGTHAFLDIVFAPNEALPQGDLVKFLIDPNDPGDRGTLVTPAFQATHLRLRIVNGNGQRTDWSQWVETH
jgi:hypothetical protein